MKKPMIGVVPLVDEERESFWMLPGYFEGIEEAGGIPVMLPLTDDPEAIARLAETCDGVLFTGGHDVSPEVYGETPREVCGACCPGRDRMERLLLDEALRRDLPVLGICRGSQLLNVSQGGTLVNHIDGHRVDLGNGNMGFMDEKVELVPDAQIAEILGGAGTIGVRSAHHQTVETPGAGLTVAAYAHDNSIEAIEHAEKQWVIGLQWHPEEASANVDHRRHIFQSLITQAREQHQEAKQPALQR